MTPMKNYFGFIAFTAVLVLTTRVALANSATLTPISTAPVTMAFSPATMPPPIPTQPKNLA